MRYQIRKPKRLLFTWLIVVLVSGFAIQDAHSALQLYWPFDDDTLPIATDQSGNGRNGTITAGDPVFNLNVPPIAPFGTTAQSVLFDNSDGNNGKVQANGYKAITGTNPRTTSAWVRLTDSGSRTIMFWGSNVATQKWVWRTDGGKTRVEVNGGFKVGATAVNDNAWHHVAATWENDGSPNVLDVKLYVDGVLDGTSSSQSKGVSTASGSDFRVGIAESNGKDFRGRIDEAALWNEVLSPAQIWGLANTARTPLDANAATADRFFDGDTDTDWLTAANWGTAGNTATDVVPVTDENVYIGMGDSAVLSTIGGGAQILRIGHNNATRPGAGTLTLNTTAAELTAKEIRLGSDGATFNGTLTFEKGTIDINASSTEAIYVGYDSGSIGSFTMGTAGGNDADTTLNYTGGRFEVSRIGGATGTFTLKSGTVTGNENLIIGQGGGTANVNIEGGSFTTSANMNFNSGTGNYTQTGGTVDIGAVVNQSNQNGMTSTIDISGGTLSVGTNLDDRAGASVIKLSGTGVLDFSGSTATLREVETLDMRGNSVMRFSVINNTTGVSAPLSIITDDVAANATFADTPKIEIVDSVTPSASTGTLDTWTGGNGTWDADGSKWDLTVTPAVANGAVVTGDKFDVITSPNAMTSNNLVSSGSVGWQVNAPDAMTVEIERTGAAIPGGAATAVIDGAASVVTRDSDLRIAPEVGADAARLDIDNGASLTLSGSNNLILGGGATGFVNHDGGTVTVGGDLRYGPNPGDNGGEYNLNGGTLNVLGDIVETNTAVSPAHMHVDGGTLNVTGDITVQSFRVGNASGSNGTYTLPSGKTLTGTSNFVAASSGTGELINDGGSIAVSLAKIGDNSTGIGTFTQNSGTTIITGGSATEGLDNGDANNAQGTINIKGGTFTVTGTGGWDNAEVGTGSVGNVNIGVGGGAPTVNVSGGNYETANAGTGITTMDSGIFNLTSNNIIIGQANNSVATFTMNGGTINMVGARDINFNQGDGILNLNGGVINVGSDVNLANNNNSAFATLNLNAGELNIAANLDYRTNGTMDVVNLQGATLQLAGGAIHFGNRSGANNQFNMTSGTLGNVGTFFGDLVQQGGTLDIGGSIGTMNISAGAAQTMAGDYSLLGAGTLLIEIDGTAGPGVAGGHDQLVVANNVSLLGDLDLMPSGLTSADIGSTFVILDKVAAGAIAGTLFAGLPEGTSFMDTDYWFSITYQGGNGNDVELTLFKLIPEPSSCLPAAIGLIGLIFFGRRRRKR